MLVASYTQPINRTAVAVNRKSSQTICGGDVVFQDRKRSIEASAGYVLFWIDTQREQCLSSGSFRKKRIWVYFSFVSMLVASYTHPIKKLLWNLPDTTVHLCQYDHYAPLLSSAETSRISSSSRTHVHPSPL